MIDYLIKLMPSMTEGLSVTINLFALTLLLSLPLGMIIALGRLSKNKMISGSVQLYTWVMRGTPLMLQLVFVFFGLPLIGIAFDRYEAALLAFVLNYAAYFAEIFRSGIQSIETGQHEAAKVLGYSPSKSFFRIILPQVVKRVLPPVANEFITLVKDTSLVYVVGLGELLRAGKIAANRDASLVPLIVVALFYLLLTAILTQFFKYCEDKTSYYE
ncbi:MAG: polar amino acid transporter, inner rane subunit [Bacillales bacterium]|jgi:polar amino acid transport system permease protein|nr:polar amino acid transporter, inner rane subunit [Bacillales bacterium]